MLHLLAIKNKVVKEDLHERWDIFVEYLGDDSLKHGWCRFKTESDYFGHEDTQFCDKSHFLLIVQVHTYLIIATEHI